MANEAIGEVDLQVGSTTYTLRMTNNAYCIIEADLGISTKRLNDKIVAEEDLPQIELRTMLWAALRKSHPKITRDQASDIIDEIGLNHATEVVMKAWFISFRLEHQRQEARAGRAIPLVTAGLPGANSTGIPS